MIAARSCLRFLTYGARAASAAVAASFAVACSDPVAVSDQLERADFWVELRLDSGGVMGRGSELRDIAPSIRVEAADPPDHTIVLAWSRATLDAVGLAPPPAGERAGDPAEPAHGGCGLRMPPPDVALDVGRDGSLAPARAEMVVPITFEWVRTRCPPFRRAEAPAVFAPIFVESSCAHSACRTRIEGGPCELSIVTSECSTLGVTSQATFGASIDARGEVCLEAPSCGPARGIDPVALSCANPEGGACDIRLRRPAEPRALDVRRVAVSSGVEPQVPWLPESGNLGAREGHHGYLSDLLPLDDRVIVAVRAGWRSQLCEGTDPTRLVSIDRRTMAAVRTATAPPCLWRMVEDPSGDGFVAVFGEPPDLAIGRFTAGGALVRARAIPGIAPRPGFRAWIPDLVALSSGRFAVLISEQDVTFGVPGGTERLQIVGADLEPDGPPRILAESAEARAIAALPGGGVAYAEDRGNDVIFDDLRGAGAPGVVHIFAAGAVSLMSVVALGDGSVLVLHAGSQPAVTNVASNHFLRTAIFFEAAADPTAAAVGAGGRVLVASRAHSTAAGELVIAELDLERAAFLPGAVRVGAGVAARARADEGGAVWFLLPWSSEVARVVAQ